MKHQHEYKDWILPQRVFPSKEREDKTMRDVIQIFIHGSTQLSTRTSWTSGRLWAKSRRTALRTKAPSEHSFQKEVRTSAEEREPWVLVESSRQAETTSTRPEVIAVTRQRQDREDHEDGHRYCGGNRRQAICICPAFIHQKQPPTLYLTAKRRTKTFSRCTKGA